MGYTHRVKRTFPSKDVLQSGQLVDAGGWKNRRMLEKTGYIVPLEQEQKTEETDERLLGTGKLSDLPKTPKAPKAPKAPKTPKIPKAPKAPKAK